MTVSELRSLLYYMPQDARINISNGYDPEYGICYKDVDSVEQENVGWDDVNNEVIVEVYIL